MSKERERKAGSEGFPLDSIGVVYESDRFNNHEGGFLLPADDDIREVPDRDSFFSWINKTVLQHYNRVKKISRLPGQAKTQLFRSAKLIKFSFSSQINKLGVYRTGLTVCLIFLALFFATFRAVGAKDDLNIVALRAENHLGEAFESIDKGDLGTGLTKAEAAQNDIKRLKILTQAWGQDIKYLSFIPAHDSSLVALERFLDSAYQIMEGFESSNQLLRTNIAQSIESSPQTDLVPKVDLSFVQAGLAKSLGQMKHDLENSRDQLGLAADSLPLNLAIQGRKVSEIINRLISSLDSSQTFLTKGLPAIIGADRKPKNILLLFQNNTELRGSGGFIGSFAVLRFEDGKIDRIDFETNIYKLDKSFLTHEQIAPPVELAPFIGNSWAMRDSNFAIDGPESFNKVMEFYQKETGNQVDGVMALDTTFITELLKITGPIEMPEFNTVINSENFLKDVQYEVEIGYFDRAENQAENEPKKILALMMPKFLNKLVDNLKDSDKSKQILAVFHQALTEKHLLFCFKDKEVQAMIDEMNYSGRVGYKLTDYLFVHNTNIGGAKSSLNVAENLYHQVLIDTKGNVSSNLKIERAHQGDGNWPDGINKNLVRVLLPQGSTVEKFNPVQGNFWPAYKKELAGQEAFSIGEEAGKAKLTYWQNTEPGQKSIADINYTSNYRLNTGNDTFAYRLFIQKQPGTIGDHYELELTYPEGYLPQNVKNYDFINRKILIKEELKTDKEIVVNFKRVK